MTPPPIIVGDVGGTNCRFALAHLHENDRIELSQISRLQVAGFANFYDALARYISQLEIAPTRAAFAVAGPKFNGEIKMTNVDWSVAESELKARFGFEAINLANDFAAMARGAAIMPDDGFTTLIEGKVNYSQTVAVLGPGTGLGVAGILPSRAQGGALRILSTEGGYTAFAPQDDIQTEILKWLMTQFDFVAAEHVISGPGLLNIYRALCHIRGEAVIATQPSEVVNGAEANPKSIARKAVRIFCDVLGGFAGNTAYTLGASGGVIITGGVSRHIAPFIADSDFTSRFKRRGKASWFTQNIPVRLLSAHAVALYGAAAFMGDQ